MIEGIILAGGYSSRIKKNKMTLIYNDLPIICNVIESMQDYCKKIVVVTGHYHDEIVNIVSKYQKVMVKRNNNYDLGMFSSVICGVQEMKDDFFLIPGDYPLIQKETFKLLLNSKGLIRVPIYNNRKGHPILITKQLIKSLLEEILRVVREIEANQKRINQCKTKTCDENYLKNLREEINRLKKQINRLQNQIKNLKTQPNEMKEYYPETEDVSIV